MAKSPPSRGASRSPRPGSNSGRQHARGGRQSVARAQQRRGSAPARRRIKPGRIVLGVLGAPGGDVADCLDARAADVVVATRERTFAVDLVAVEGDGVDPVGLDVRGGDREVADDVQDVAEPVLSVRLGIEPEATARVLAEILASVSVPVYPDTPVAASIPQR